MQFTTRPYGGKLFRPLPEVYLTDDQSLIIIATPWGQAQIAKDFITSVTSYWRDSIRASEKISRYIPDDGLTYDEHLFKMAILASHEDLKDKYNDEELTAGLEILCVLKNEKKITWFQVGAPSMILIRENTVIPLYHSVDFSFDFSPQGKPLPPLPKNLLGLQQHVNLGVGGLRLQKNDRFLMVSRSYIPSDFFKKLNPDTITLDTATHLFAKDNEDQPFWLGLLFMDIPNSV